jgi:putative tricarboxylic transport membrane protein
VLIGAGVLGYFLRSVDLDRTVVVLGLVLGPLVEKNFRLSLIISRGNPAVFFSTWIDDLLWLLLIVFFVGPLLIRAMAHLRPVRPAQPGPTTC